MRRPSVDLPLPGSPTRNKLPRCNCIGAFYWKRFARARLRARALTNGGDRVLDDARREEDQQLGLLGTAVGLLEGIADDRNVAEERHLVDIVAGDFLVDATDHRRVAV